MATLPGWWSVSSSRVISTGATSVIDRRVQMIRLTKVGRAEFRKMAAEHETWIADMFSELAPKEVRELMRLLAKTKGSAQRSASRRKSSPA